MPRGRSKGGKGGRRCFTNFTEVDNKKLKEQREKEWRKARGDEVSGSEEEEGSEESQSEEEESGSSSSEDEDVQRKPKGIDGLIEIENPNRVAEKMKKLSTLETDTSSQKPSLTRKEKEEVQKQRANAHYRKLHAQGKTEEAKADLERLALIRKQREEAQQRKEEERKAKEEAALAKKESVAKALNKKEKR